MKKKLLITAAVLGSSFLAIQLVPVPARTAPVQDPLRTLEAHLPVTPAARKVIEKACRDCHTYRTEWPWYSRIAPVSWLVARDVEQARRAMNLSDWVGGPGRTPGRAMGMLMAACAGVQSGRMPPAQYRLMHPDANLSAEDVKSFCSWSTASVKALRSGSLPAAGQ